MTDPLDDTLHRALQQRRTSQAGSEPEFSAMLLRARGSISAPRRSAWTHFHWLLPAAAVFAILGIMLYEHRPEPSLSALVADIAAEHQRHAVTAFGQWSPPSDGFGPAFFTKP